MRYYPMANVRLLYPRIIKCVGLLTFIGAGAAMAAPAPNLTQKFTTQLQSFQSLQADFMQTVRFADGRVEETRGQLWVLRPSKMKWHATHPDEWWLIADGKNFFQYDVGLEQVVEKPQSQAQDQTVLNIFLEKDPKIAQRFDVKLGRCAIAAQDQCYMLVAKQKDANLRSLLVGFEGAALRELKTEDAFGQITQVVLNKVQSNKPLDAKIFEFKIPKGVDHLKS